MDSTLRAQVGLAADRAALEIGEATGSALGLHLRVALKDAYLRGYEECLEGTMRRVEVVHEEVAAAEVRQPLAARLGGKR